MKRTRIRRRTFELRPVSAKQRLRKLRYERLRPDVWDRDEGVCQRCGTGGDGLVVHHKAGRVGSNLVDLDLLVLICNPCHGEIHSHPAQSRADGFMVRRVR